MYRLPHLFGLGLLGLILIVGVGITQDTKKDDKKEEKKDEKKVKGFLPPGFKDLGLIASQKETIYKILAEYKGKINELDKQIKELKKQEQQDIFKALTDEHGE